MKQNINLKTSAGQSLTILIVIVAVAMSITGAAVSMTVSNTKAASANSLSDSALSLAQAGIDNALLQLLRDPSFAGETLIIDLNPVLITVTGSTTKTIQSSATINGFTRRIQVTATYSGANLLVATWQEL